MAYIDKYGVEFSYDRKTLVRCPKDFQGEYVIPNSVTSIGDWVFAKCAGLTSITIPNSVTSIGNYAFDGCTGLASVTIPNSVTSIGKGAFRGCSGLTSVSIPNSVTSIEDWAFSECTSLTSVTIPNRVTSIGEYAFYDCSGLTFVTIPNSVLSIGNHAFRNCTALTSIIIPDSVESIGKDAFMSCGLTSIELNEKRIPEGTFLRSNFVYGLKTIMMRTFASCSSLTSIKIPNTVTKLESQAFRCCGLESIELFGRINEIGNCCFRSCSKLRSVVFNVTDESSFICIGECIFDNCPELNTIYFKHNGLLLENHTIHNVDSKTVTTLIKSRIDMIRVEIREKRKKDEYEWKIQKEIAEKEARRIDEERERMRIINARKEQELLQLQEQQMQEMLQGSILFFDTETTGTPRNYRAPVSDSYNWPRLVQLAWVMADKDGNILIKKSVIIKPNGFSIPSDASAVHGITTEQAMREGKALAEVLKEFATDLSFATQVVGYNIDFDQRIVGAELYRLNMDYDALMNKPSVCTMKSSTNFCAIPNPNPYFGGYKWPSLSELHRKLFGCDFSGAHDALADITATKDCFFELKRRGIIKD